MILFGAIAALLLAGVLVAVLTPLIVRKPRESLSSESTLAALCRDHLRELDRDLGAGLIEQDRYDEARSDIERRLLADLRCRVESTSHFVERGAGTALAAGIAISIAAAAVYWTVGSPQSLAPTPPPVEPRHALDAREAEAMIARLAARLEREPRDAEGWATLARSYTAHRRFAEAVRAYAQAAAQGIADAQLLADHADALAMAQGRRLQGEPEKLIARALSLDANHVKALALAGSASFEGGNYPAAVAHWQRLLTRVPAEAELARSIRSSIAQAQARMAEVSPATPPGAP